MCPFPPVPFLAVAAHAGATCIGELCASTLPHSTHALAARAPGASRMISAGCPTTLSEIPPACNGPL
eukprot:11818929-Alexandrium_andersonii.AAC.1